MEERVSDPTLTLSRQFSQSCQTWFDRSITSSCYVSHKHCEGSGCIFGCISWLTCPPGVRWITLSRGQIVSVVAAAWLLNRQWQAVATTTLKWIVIRFSTDIPGPQKINPQPCWPSKDVSPTDISDYHLIPAKRMTSSSIVAYFRFCC